MVGVGSTLLDRPRTARMVECHEHLEGRLDNGGGRENVDRICCCNVGNCSQFPHIDNLQNVSAATARLLLSAVLDCEQLPVGDGFGTNIHKNDK